MPAGGSCYRFASERRSHEGPSLQSGEFCPRAGRPKPKGSCALCSSGPLCCLRLSAFVLSQVILNCSLGQPNTVRTASGHHHSENTMTLAGTGGPWGERALSLGGWHSHGKGHHPTHWHLSRLLLRPPYFQPGCGNPGWWTCAIWTQKGTWSLISPTPLLARPRGAMGPAGSLPGSRQSSGTEPGLSQFGFCLFP